MSDAITQRLREMQSRVPTGHPEDVKMEEEGTAESYRTIDAFMNRRTDAMRALILLYPDAEAIELLEMLREEFWGLHQREWPRVPK